MVTARPALHERSKPRMEPAPFQAADLLSIQDLTPYDIEEIFDLSRRSSRVRRCSEARLPASSSY